MAPKERNIAMMGYRSVGKLNKKSSCLFAQFLKSKKWNQPHS